MKSRDHRSARPGGDDHLVDAHVQPELFIVGIGNSFPQRQQAQAVGVFRLTGQQGFARCLADVRRSLEVRLADLEVDDVPALPLQLLGPLQHFHHVERRQCHRFA